MKQCSGCRRTLPSSSYSSNNARIDKLNNECKDCKWERETERRYGVSPQKYDEIYTSQGGRCALCDRHQTEFNRRLAVDHCHKTGKVRGLLCTGCNVAIGRLGDGPDGLRKALTYVSGVCHVTGK